MSAMPTPTRAYTHPTAELGGLVADMRTRIAAVERIAHRHGDGGTDTGGGGGGTGTDEVWIGTDDPINTAPTVELWYDVDAVAPTGGVAYAFNQSVSAATWTVVHGLGWMPNVTVIDSSGAVVEGDISYDSINQVTLRFSGAFSGVAYLS